MQTQEKRETKSSGFIMITREMLMSQAYKELKPSAAKALPLFLMQVKHPYTDPLRYYGTEFRFTYSIANKRFGFADRTFANAIKQLVKYGFIEQVSKGGIKKGLNIESVFKLSDKWKSYNAENTTTPETDSTENTSQTVNS